MRSKLCNRVGGVVAGTLVMAIGGGALASDAGLVRIEPRPFYGATITLEAGVRVFRPLPAQKYVIINPDHKTPLSLNLSEINETSHSYNYNHNYNHGGGDSFSGASGFFPNGHSSPHRHGRKSYSGISPRPGGVKGGGYGGHGGHGGHSGGGFSR